MSETETSKAEPAAAPSTPPTGTAPDPKKDRKDSTTELPMYDLGEILNFVTGIHDKALETSPMPEVAKGMSYGNPSSTPFYRRMTAARLFGLLSSSRAELTVRAKDYLKPDGDDIRTKALQDAILSVSYYHEEVTKHLGKKINLGFIANSFTKVLPISDSCAKTCAKVFEDSLKVAGFIAPDGTVRLPTGSSTEPEKSGSGEEQEEEEEKGSNMKPHILHLDKKGERFVKVSAPLDITPAEIRRIQKWMEVTLLIDWAPDEGGSQ